VIGLVIKTDVERLRILNAPIGKFVPFEGVSARLVDEVLIERVERESIHS
jgi:hypothetical protein